MSKHRTPTRWSKLSTRINVGFVLLAVGIVVMLLLMAGCAQPAEPGPSKAEEAALLAEYPVLDGQMPPYTVHFARICEYVADHPEEEADAEYLSVLWAVEYDIRDLNATKALAELALEHCDDYDY